MTEVTHPPVARCCCCVVGRKPGEINSWNAAPRVLHMYIRMCISRNYHFFYFFSSRAWINYGATRTSWPPPARFPLSFRSDTRETRCRLYRSNGIQFAYQTLPPLVRKRTKKRRRRRSVLNMNLRDDFFLLYFLPSRERGAITLIASKSRQERERNVSDKSMHRIGEMRKSAF